ncbi:ubiquitin carboxyl-terminal hydrolase BAP1-like [Asterias rubens]|uniref:ubiquitin carboxyl-terminal hydrolase BAP1-like n=1 Tax=Asterias rubens TaxID=7604 RepID=UPI0014553CBE|nr:ubiquitin carboxyl-terminal hydrolase BAP1-like [Asterias rubens]
MNDGWLELESDPGLFTLLVEEFGVTGVQVEEIYDLQKPIEGPVYGFIFLFKWIEERRARRKVQPNGDEAYLTDIQATRDMFFAHQIVPNSCATHALLSVLLNCPSIKLGETLSSLRDYTRDFGPENKGYAIGNVPELAQIHNSHAHPEPRQIPEKQIGILTTRARETFHFVSYVPIKDRLIELDGLKPHPIDHGLWGENEDWTEKFRRVIGERLENEGGSSDIRFNLMAVVGDRCQSYEQKLDTLKNNKQIILDALDQLIQATHPHLFVEAKHQLSLQMSESEPTSADSMRAPSPMRHHDTTAHQPLPSPPTLPAHSLVPTHKPVTPMHLPDTTSEASTHQPLPAHQTVPNARRFVPRELRDPDWNPSKDHHQGSSSSASKKKKKKKKKKHKKHKKHSKKIKSFETLQPYRLPPALDSHNYAKSPLMSDDDISALSSASSTSESESNYLTDDESDVDGKNARSRDYKTESILKKNVGDADRGESSILRVTFKEEKGLDPQIHSQPKTVDGRYDMSKQLSIQTVFENKEMPSPSSSSGSTDTASEMGSAFNSPICSATASRSCSPNMTKLLKFQHWKSSTVTDLNAQLEASVAEGHTRARSSGGRFIQTRRSALKRASIDGLPDSTSMVSSTSQGDTLGLNNAMCSSSLGMPAAQASPSLLLSQHGKPPFAQRDLLELLKSVEAEIDVYEQKLLDENEKRNKYKIDDCRRSHNYDPFICTFLSMLAEQGKLASLVEKHTLIKRRQGVPLGRLKKTTNRSRDRRRRKARPQPSVAAKKRKIR